MRQKLILFVEDRGPQIDGATLYKLVGDQEMAWHERKRKMNMFSHELYEY